METTDVAVIGAGPAGLAVGACLAKAGLSFVILEKNRQVGSSWRRHYDRLHLHTIKRFSSLPHLSFPAAYPRYVPRKLMIEYLESYADHFGLRPRFGESVSSVRREDDGWRLQATSSSIGAHHVVIASGLIAEPVIPSFPGLGNFKGRVLHSSDYVNARPFSGQSVLVIGMGNTGAEIALDLCEGGARPVLSLRGGVHVVPRDLFGIPIQVVAMICTKLLPTRVNDVLFPPLLDLALGYPAKHGLKRPKEGILQQIARIGRIPVLDVGTTRKISEGSIAIAPGISAMTGNGAIFDDGNERAFDTIILATGFRPSYSRFLDAGSDDRAIYFVGFTNPVTGLLREIARDAVRTVDDIVRQSAGRAPCLSPKANGQSTGP